jgi:hypothetical protein
MGTIEALSELLIFSREHGADDTEINPRAARAAAVVEKQLLAMRDSASRRRTGLICVRCEQRRGTGMLCWACEAEAPTKVREAFFRASGVDGMRRATKLVMSWARPERQQQRERRAA